MCSYRLQPSKFSQCVSDSISLYGIFLQSCNCFMHVSLSESKDDAYGPFLAKEMGKLLEIGEQGPVMVHCAMGKRAGQLQ